MIYIIAHDKIHFDMYDTASSDSKEMYSFFLTAGKRKHDSISNKLISDITKQGFKYKLEWQLPKYNGMLQEKRFFAPSVLYHFHLNSSTLISDEKYMGLLEYDLQHTLGVFSNKVRRSIASVANNERFIIFPSIRHPLSRLDNQKNIMMCNQHWLNFFIDDYNTRYSATINIKEFRKDFCDELIPTQQSFICDIETFKEIAEYVYCFIELHGYHHKNIDFIYRPFPATIMERFISLYAFILSQKMTTFRIPLQHIHSSAGRY